MTTTIEMYEAPPTEHRQTTGLDLMRELGRAQGVASDALGSLATTVEPGPTLTPAQRAQYLRELAERSVRPDAGLDRDLADEINREAWGFNGK